MRRILGSCCLWGMELVALTVLTLLVMCLVGFFPWSSNMDKAGIEEGPVKGEMR